MKSALAEIIAEYVVFMLLSSATRALITTTQLPRSSGHGMKESMKPALAETGNQDIGNIKEICLKQARELSTSICAAAGSNIQLLRN